MKDLRLVQSKIKEDLIDAEMVRQLFDYSIVTGRLYYKYDGSGKGGWQQVKGKKAGHDQVFRYRTVRVYGVAFSEHRVVWLWVTGSWPKDQIDHINRARGCNAWHNLAEANNRINHQNRTNNTSGTPGVVFDKARQRWKAYCKIDYVMYNIGRYDTQAEAVEARNKYLADRNLQHERKI